MNWKIFVSCRDIIEVLSLHFPGGTEVNHDKFLSG
jgi:hypothetical protein